MSTPLMQPVVTDECGVCLSVCHAAHLGFTVQKVAEQIKIPFGVNTSAGPWNTVLDVVPYPPHREGEGDLLLSLGTSLISPEWLKLEACNFACI